MDNLVTAVNPPHAKEPLADTRFYLHGESPAVAGALAQYLSGRGAQVIALSRLGELIPAEEFDNVVLVHITAEQASHGACST